MVTPITVDPSRWVPLEHTSNDPLPDMQKREIEASIFEVQEEKQLLDTEISRIQHVLENLQLEVSSKNTGIATLKAIISPLKDLPNELISKVFEEYALESSQPPWPLGQVCSRWREVALMTPSLWNRVIVRFRDSNPTYSAFDKETVLLRRAAKALISCTLILSRPSPSIYYFLPLFTRYASRLRHLSLKSVDAFLPLLTLPGGSLSSLETLDLNFFPQRQKTVHAISRAGEAPQYRAITLFEQVPRLRRVSIETGPYYRWIDPNLLPLRLPWDQLTHLLLSPYLCADFGILSAVLQHCTNLTRCRFPIPVDEPNSTQSTLIKLRHLEALEITNGFVEELEHNGQLLRQLILPSLKRLILTSRAGNAVGWPEQDIIDLILRSACDIEVFHGRSYLSNDTTLVLLHTMPSLTELLVQGVTVLPFILGRMAHQDFLPNVTSIECRSYQLFSDTCDELVEVLGETGFMEPSSDGCMPLSVHIITEGEAFIEYQSDELERNWLQVRFQQIPGRLMDKECEL